MRKLLGILFLFLLGASWLPGDGVFAAWPAQQFEANRGTVRLAKNPEPIQEFILNTVDAKSIGSKEWQGKVVLVTFWATWCPPCLDEIPELIKLRSKYADHLEIVGLSMDSGPPDVVNPFLKLFAEQRGINYPVAIASPELQAKFGGILGLPTAFLLDDRGRVVQKHVGTADPALYEAEIRALLGLSLDAKIERFENPGGQVFLANVRQAQQPPGVDLSKLVPEQKERVLRLLNERICSCGCRLTLAQCRINDSTCPRSLKEAADIVARIRAEARSQEAQPRQEP